MREPWSGRGGPIFLGPVGAAFISYFFSPDLRTQVAYGSAILELFGFGLVFVQLRDKPAAVGDRGLWHRFWAWQKRLRAAFTGEQSIHRVVASKALFGDSFSANVDPFVGESIEEKVNHLLREIDRLDTRLTESEQKLQGVLIEFHEALNRERQGRQNEIKQLRGQLREVTLGSYYLELIGALWFVFGIAGTTFAGQIASVLGRILNVVGA